MINSGRMAFMACLVAQTCRRSVSAKIEVLLPGLFEPSRRLPKKLLNRADKFSRTKRLVEDRRWFQRVGVGSQRLVGQPRHHDNRNQPGQARVIERLLD